MKMPHNSGDSESVSIGKSIHSSIPKSIHCNTSANITLSSLSSSTIAVLTQSSNKVVVKKELRKKELPPSDSQILTHQHQNPHPPIALHLESSNSGATNFTIHSANPLSLTQPQSLSARPSSSSQCSSSANLSGTKTKINIKSEPNGNEEMHRVVLPESLESIQKSDYFPCQRHRWNTNEEIAAILIALDRHEQWLMKEVKIRPKSGSMMLYSRKRVRYRRDGYCWKKRKDGKTTREDHMKLKVQGHECIYGCYVHSAILPTFHRRCYWLLQNPDIVLVHYLNVPYSDDNKVISPTLNYFTDNKKEWTKEELISELKPMFFSENEPDLNNELEISTAATIESIVKQLMVKQRAKVKALEDASDIGINAKALTVVTAITNSAREFKQNSSITTGATISDAKPMEKNFNNSHTKLTTVATTLKSQQKVVHVPTKRDVATCIITTSVPTTVNASITSGNASNTKGATVQLVQLAAAAAAGQNLKGANNVMTNGNSAQSVTSTQSSTSTSASLIFNLSQLQSGSGLLILNSPSQGNNGTADGQSQSITGPLTLLYGRPSTSNSVSDGQSSTTIPAVVCSNPQLRTLLRTANLAVNGNFNLKPNGNGTTIINQLNSNSNISPSSLSLSTKTQSQMSISTSSVNQDVVNSNTDNDNGNLKMDMFNESPHTNNSIDNTERGTDGHLTTYTGDESMIIGNTPNSSPENTHIIMDKESPSSALQLSHDDSSATSNSSIDNSSLSSSLSSSSLPILENHALVNQNNLNHHSHIHHNQNYYLPLHNQHQIQQNQNQLMQHYDLVDPNDLNPMDFIDNDIPTPDEALFNLEAFEMLGDIDNLDDIANPNLSPFRTISGGPMAVTHNNYLNVNDNDNNQNYIQLHHIKSESNGQLSQFGDYRDHREMPATAAHITDYSPEWCYPEGGIKVLVAGPWYSAMVTYTILFDGVSVATQLVQSGVLRCYCPAHEPGFVTLQVACDGMIISNSVIFEYRDHPSVPSQKADHYFSIDDNVFKFSILERLEMLETRLSRNASHKRNSLSLGNDASVRNMKQSSTGSFEDRLLSMVNHMMTLSWLPYDEGIITRDSLRAGLSSQSMSLIHLAAALNYSKLIASLLRWRSDSPSVILELEIDAFAADCNDCTPLMWSCGRGHYESSMILYHWNRAAVNLCNSLGHSPLYVARERGFEQLALDIENLERDPKISQKSIFDQMINRKSSLQIPLREYGTVKRGLSTLGQGTRSPRLIKCLSADATFSSSPPSLPVHHNQIQHKPTLVNNSFTFNSSNESSNGDVLLSSCITSCDYEDDSPDLPLSAMSSARGSTSSELMIDAAEPSRVLTLAEHIIAAIPDRIKAASSASHDHDDNDYNDYNDDDDDDDDCSDCCDDASDVILTATNDNHLSHVLPIHTQGHAPDSLNQSFNDDVLTFPFELNTDSYHYRDAVTPSTSSPASSSCLQSPGSFHLESPSPPPTTADFCEFFHASGKIIKELGDLTLTDKEQRELYEAARVIQKAYRSYKGRKIQQDKEEMDKEKEKAAAILIQSYYRRYKQYMYYRQMTKAAQVIQNQYRSYCEHKRFKKCLNHDSDGSIIDGNSYMIVDSGGVNVVNQNVYYPRNSFSSYNSSREGTPSIGLKRTYSQRRQHQAARKIQQFMRQSKNKLQRERAMAAERHETYICHHSQCQCQCQFQDQVMGHSQIHAQNCSTTAQPQSQPYSSNCPSNDDPVS